MNETETIRFMNDIDSNDNTFFLPFENEIIGSRQAILNKWSSHLHTLGINYQKIENDSLSNIITLNSDTIKYLKYRRNGFKPTDNFTSFIEKYNDTKRKRIEFGGYISSYNTIEEKYKEEGGAIHNYIYMKNIINYHTHPPYDRKWPVNPPSQDDLISIINMSIRDNYIYIGLIASFEGIYVYNLFPEFLKKIKGNSLDSLGDIENYFIDLRNLLGYSKEQKIKKAKKEEVKPDNPLKPLQLFDNYEDEDDNDIEYVPKKLFGGNIPHSLLEYNNSKITINQFMESLNEMGISIKFFSYDEENITIPINFEALGGRYKINYTK